MDGTWTASTTFDESFRGFIAFLLVISLSLLAYHAHRRHPLPFPLALCAVFLLLWLYDAPFWAAVGATNLGFVGDALLKALDPQRGIPWKRWRDFGIQVASLIAFQAYWFLSFKSPEPDRLQILGEQISFDQGFQKVDFGREGVTVTVLADRAGAGMTWVIRSSGPKVRQIRLNGSDTYFAKNGDALTGDELGLRIAAWADAKPLIKYNPDLGGPMTARR